MPDLSKVTARQALKPRRDPYWDRLAQGQFLGFRKMSKVSEGTWSARLLDQSTGKQIYKTLGDFADQPPNLRYDLASKKARAWFTHLGLGGSQIDLTVKDACIRYISKTKSERGEKPANDIEQRFNRRVFNELKLSSTPLTKLNPSMLEEWKMKNLKDPAITGKQRGKPRSASSVNRDMACFKAALNLALQDGLITSDFAWKTKLAPIKNATKRRNVYLDKSQRQKLVASCPGDLKNFVRAACLLPLRPGAIANLTVGSLDIRLNTLTVGKDKHGHDRKIPLPNSIASFLSKMCKGKLPTAQLFTREDGTPWNKDSWKYPFKDAAAIAGLTEEAVMYNLRHSVITDLIHSGLDILTVAQFSGTSVAMIDKHYGHITREHGKIALDSLMI